MFPRSNIAVSLLVVAIAAGGFALLRSKTSATQAPLLLADSLHAPASGGSAAGADSQPDASARILDSSRWAGLMKIKDGTARQKELMELLAGLRPEDYPRAEEKLRALGVAADSEEMQLLTSAWCNADIHAAATFVLGGGVPELIAVVAEDWAIRDYDEAAAWALGIPSEPHDGVRDYAVARVILPTVKQNPGRALATLARADGIGYRFTRQVFAAVMSRCPGVIQGLIASMPEEKNRQWATGEMASLVAFHGGMIWDVSLPGGSVRNREEVVSTSTPGERAEAAAWIASYSHSAPVDGRMTEPRLFLEYALDDPATAAALVESMPAGVTRENASAGIAAAIAANEGIEAGMTYLKDSPESTQELLLDAWGRHVGQEDPGRVLAMAEQLAELPAGKNPIIFAFSSLHRGDAAAADRWLEAHPQFTALLEGYR